ncbi:unnamed protein product [Brassica oleracea var. botrytis]
MTLYGSDRRLVVNRGLCAIAQAESLRYKILSVVISLADFGIILYMACYNVFRFVMKSGDKGCEVIVCGKHRAARVKSMNFKSFESFNQNLTIYL